MQIPPIQKPSLLLIRIVAFNMVLFGFKYLFGYEDNSKKNISLCIMLPKMNAYGKDFEGTR